MDILESLHTQVDLHNIKLNIPTLSNEVGELLRFFVSLHRPKIIVEFGSGIGASVLWSLLKDHKDEPTWQQFVLTERREDCFESFQQINWPIEIYKKLCFIQGEWNIHKITEVIQGCSIQLFLVDGQKNQYRKVIEEIYPLLSKQGLILIDNTNWLETQKAKSKNVVSCLQDMHESLSKDPRFYYVFLPKIADGLSLLVKV